ncbi:hypothetical protein XSR1_410002 [Xenorhabdus szentirmaii DSM 16338]|uniref:Uncharacterized protein n=1 Tax=Xenorhabdus szentirmaii DSM 16338 TaxID=1427518 RepID=W1J2W0_9GAMM|nr:hypothetical protein XSR1_410002 [Xenorhabdus szentirmaii DSM 16338]
MQVTPIWLKNERVGTANMNKKQPVYKGCTSPYYQYWMEKLVSCLNLSE